MYYVGHDGHKDISVFCITTASGNVKETFEVPATPEGMDVLIEKMKGKKFKVLAEASTYTIDLHDHLVSKGVESYLAHPHTLKLITESCRKTDRNDSKTLASNLRLWDKHELDISISFVVDGDNRSLRELCRLRESVSEMKGSTMQQIKSHMRINGQYVEFEDLKTMKARKHIRENFCEDLCLMMLLDMYVVFEDKGKILDSEIERRFGDRNEVQLLATIPGVGITTAAQLMSMIVDVHRFPTADKMRSYFGMAPTVRDSGGSLKHGHITRRGDPMMRKILSRVVAQMIKNAPSDNLAVYRESHRSAMRPGMLMVACMNRLLDIIYAVLVRGTPYIHM